MFKSSAPVSEEQLQQALELIKLGEATESRVQRLLGIRASLARKVIDTLVEQGQVYRHQRELHVYIPPYTEEDFDPELIPKIQQAIGTMSHTALSIKRKLGVSERALRATLAHMLQAGMVEGQRVEALIIYRNVEQTIYRTVQTAKTE